LARESRHWGDFPQTWKQNFPDDTLHFLDAPGVGDQRHRQSPLSVAALVADMRKRWQSMAPNEPCALLSLSLGGMLGMHWTSAHAEDFVMHIAMNTSSADLGAPWERMRWGALAMLARTLLAWGPKRREAIVLHQVSNRSEVRRQQAPAWADIAADAPIQRSTAIRQLIAAARYVRPPQLAVPTLFLGSAGDRLMRPQCTLRLAEALGAPWAMHDDAGHDLPLDAAQWVCEQVRGFRNSQELR